MTDRAPSCPVATTFSYTLLFHLMSSLPSFVELMSSLGLEDGASHPHTVRSFLRPRSHSNASSSSDIDDEREHSPQQYTPPGAYLFVSADYDRRDCSNLVDIDVAPRYLATARADTLLIPPTRYAQTFLDGSVPSSTTFIVSVICAAPKKGKPPIIARDRESEEGTFLHRSLHMNFVNTDATIGALHLATVLSSNPGTSGTKVLSERETVKAWQRDVATKQISSSTPPYRRFLRRKSPQMSPTSETFPRTEFD